MKNTQFGFSLIELILVIGIGLTLFGFVGLNLVNGQRIASVNSSGDSLISDTSSQQTKAMQGAGDTSGINYGIYFLEDRYILFKGSAYSGSDPDNYTVMLDEGTVFINITFPNSSVVYEGRSGEVIGFTNGNNTLQIKDDQGSKLNTITINRYGVVSGGN